MSTRHPLRLNPESSDYVDPKECSLIRIFHTGFKDEGAWAIDAAKLDAEGNVVGYTEASWERPTWSEVVAILDEFVRIEVPHLAVSADIPWVIQGEQGTSTLTYWENDKPVGYQSVCATCGWRGELRRWNEFGEDDASVVAGDDGADHERQTGHLWKEA